MHKKHSKNKSNMMKKVATGATIMILTGGLGFQTYQAHQLEQNLSGIEQKYSQTIQNLNEAKDENKNLLLQNGDLEEQVKGLTENTEALTQSNESLKKEVEGKQATIDSKDSEINELRSQIKQLKTSANSNSAATSKATTKATSTTTTTSNSSAKATYTMTAFAYTTASNGDPYTSGKWGNLTASGTTVKQGRTIAVDKNLIPLGTKVRLTFPKGWEHLNGTFIAEDTGNAIKGNKIDVYFDSYNTCIKFGKQTVKLEVL